MTTGGYAIHTSFRNTKLPGWSYSSFTSARALYRDEIVAVKTDGSETVRRFCHMHNNQTDYLSEAMPVPSQDGKRIIFSSNWGEISGRPVGTYVVDARAACSGPRPLRLGRDRRSGQYAFPWPGDDPGGENFPRVATQGRAFRRVVHASGFRF